MATQQPEETQETKIKRPLLVWVLFIYATLSLTSLISYYFIVSGDLVVEGVVGEYHKSLQTLDHVLNIITPIYFYFCALQLFRLKANALNLFLGYIPLMAALLTHNFFSPTWRALIAEEPLGYYSTIVNFILYFAYAYYAYLLIKKGTLK